MKTLILVATLASSLTFASASASETLAVNVDPIKNDKIIFEGVSHRVPKFIKLKDNVNSAHVHDVVFKGGITYDVHKLIHDDRTSRAIIHLLFVHSDSYVEVK